METCIKHLTQYAAMIKTNQGAQSDESIGRLRKIIGEMEAYLGLSDRRAREEQFDKMLRRAVQDESGIRGTENCRCEWIIPLSE